jgi:hypothetical protein
MTTGTIEYKLKQITKRSEKCFVRDFQTTSNEFRQLISDDYMGVFAILMTGYAFSLFFLIVELVIKHKDMIQRKFLILLTMIKTKILVLRIEIQLLFSNIWSAMKGLRVF